MSLILEALAGITVISSSPLDIPLTEISKIYSLSSEFALYETSFTVMLAVPPLLVTLK